MHHPVKAVAEAGGWSDVATPITRCQQPDDDALLAVFHELRKCRQRGATPVLRAAE